MTDDPVVQDAELFATSRFKVEVRDDLGDVHFVFLFRHKHDAKAWRDMVVLPTYENLEAHLHRGPGHWRGETGHAHHQMDQVRNGPWVMSLDGVDPYRLIELVSDTMRVVLPSAFVLPTRLVRHRTWAVEHIIT